MTQSQPQPNSPRPETSATAWTNPADAPPPFPNTPTNPYRSYGEDANQTHAPGTYMPGTYAAAPLSGRQRVSSDERTWAILAHLSPVIAWAVSAGWLNFVGPLVVYLLKKDQSRFVRNASAGAFNFAVSMAIVTILGWILTFTVIGAVIGIPMIVVGGVGSLVLGIIGAVKAANDEAYTYPMQIKILN